MSSTILARGIAKRYGDLLALDGVSFSAEAGEVLGVLGPNGAGKTTAIRVLTTILEPTTGTFSVAGVPHGRPEEIRRRIGVLPESAGYPERQTGGEFLRYHARLYGRSGRGARDTAATLLAEVGLGDREDHLIASYSRGMRQRLGIARALVNDPRVVFLDEPTLGLDPAGQRQMLAIISRIAGELDATVLLCTHLLDEVEQICTRVLILHRGRVVAHGTVAEVAARAAAPRTATIRFADDDLAAARTALSGFEVTPAAGGLTVALDGGDSNEALRRLLDAGVSVRAYELGAARLSDAFLAVTAGGR
ncbi:MAG: ABC transporter ATP-binding protein [Solirubrobacterales bacterium]|nr:ABC transporter ATP-binding protein [Solirubrobacterales bacterium]